MANVQNKPNSPASDAPAEVYGEAKAQPLPRVILRALPGQFLNRFGLPDDGSDDRST
jgi:hypothetical protein